MTDRNTKGKVVGLADLTIMGTDSVTREAE